MVYVFLVWEGRAGEDLLLEGSPAIYRDVNTNIRSLFWGSHLQHHAEEPHVGGQAAQEGRLLLETHQR